MKAALKEMAIDIDKLPLGKLSQAAIKQGYVVLGELREAITSGADGRRILDLTTRFYVAIPHSFGSSRPPTIDTEEKVTEKVGLLDQLADMEAAMATMEGDSEDEASAKDDAVRAKYDKLNCNITTLSHDSDIFKMVEKYVKNTHAPTHRGYSITVLEVFEVDCAGQAERFKEYAQDKNRMLLWHGSRITNWCGILSQGLRIAPPEAPATGYMFGKGVYFADMVSKSANYCFTTPQKNTGILTLNEVALGKQMELKNAAFVWSQQAGQSPPTGGGFGFGSGTQLPADCLSTFGIGSTQPDASDYEVLETGCKVPLGKLTTPKSVGSTSLRYNEFIVYDTKQIWTRYLVQCRFNWDKYVKYL